MPRSLASLGDLMLTLFPSRKKDPASAEYAPAKTFIKVDLPAPLSPTSAITSPRATSKSASRRACSPPKLLSIPLTTRCAGGASCPTKCFLEVIEPLSLTECGFCCFTLANHIFGN